MHDIADELSMTVGGSSDRIEASGYRMRSPNTGDRRSSPIERTGGTDPEGPSK